MKMAVNSHFLIKLNFFPHLDSGCSLILMNPGREDFFSPTQTLIHYKTTARFASTAFLLVFCFSFFFFFTFASIQSIVQLLL